MALTLTSPAFSHGDAIPPRHARDGENLSPPLRWAGVPEGTKSLALVVEDPDAPRGTFGHWAVFDIPPDRDGLHEGEALAAQGTNDFGNARYDGPQPPRGHGVHHYHFRLAALDVPRLAVAARAGVGEVWEAARGHALETAELVGTFRRDG